MSVTLENTLASSPSIERGYAYNMYADGKKGDRLTYTVKGSVFLRNLEDLSKSRIFAGEHKGNVKVALSSPNGEYIASGDDQGRMLIWGQSNYMIKSDFTMNKCIRDISWSDDGKRLVVAGSGMEGMAKAIAWDTGSEIGKIVGHDNTKTLLSCDYKKTRPFRVVTGGEDMKIGYSEGPPFKMKTFNKEHSNYINKVKFSPNGEKYCSVSSDKKINIYEGKDGTFVKTIESKTNGHTGSIYSFDWSPDSTKVLTCGADKMAKIWNVESGECETTFVLGKDVNDMQMSALWHGEYIISVSLSGAMNFLDPADPSKPKRVLMGHAADVTDLAMDPASSVFYSSDQNGVLCSWREGVATWFTGKGHGKAIRAIALNSDKTKIATVGLDDSLRVNECKENAFADTGTPLGGVGYCVAAGTKTADLFVVGTSKNQLVIVKGGNSQKFDVPLKPTSLAFNPEENKLAVGFDKDGVKVYDWTDGEMKLSYEMKDFKRRTTKVTWSPCGTYLTCCGADRQTLVFKGEEQLNKSNWEFHAGEVTDCAWSPSGKSVASVSSDLTLLVWTDTEKFTTTRAKAEMAHRVGIVKVGYLSEDTIVTVGADSCLKIWKVA